MTYVGIDQSYSGFGLTFLYEDGTYKTQVKKFDPKKSAGVNRLSDIIVWLDMQIAANDGEIIEHVCMEGYAQGSKFGREVAGELAGVVKLTLRSFDFDREETCFPTIVAPTSLKKFVTGSGTAKKNEILLGVYKKYGVEFTDDNAADSYGLAQIAKAIHTSTTKFKYEDEVLEKLTPHTERP
jgi:hypothetical protein